MHVCIPRILCRSSSLRFACTHACVHVCLRVCVRVCMYVCQSVCMHTHCGPLQQTWMNVLQVGQRRQIWKLASPGPDPHRQASLVTNLPLVMHLSVCPRTRRCSPSSPGPLLVSKKLQKQQWDDGLVGTLLAPDGVGGTVLLCLYTVCMHLHTHAYIHACVQVCAYAPCVTT